MTVPRGRPRFPGMDAKYPTQRVEIGFVGGSPRRLARMAGLLYLVNIVGGAFAFGFVPAAVTAHTIQAHELLYRFGLVSHLIVTVTNVPMAVLFYELFKVVNRRLAMLDVCLTLVATAIEAAGLLNQFAPLVPGSGPYVDLSTIDYDIHTVFYGFDFLCVAYLVYRSTFLPRTIGVLLAIDGVAYLAHSFTDLLVPGFAAHLVPWIELPPIVCEGSLCLWLIVVGVHVGRWQERANASHRDAIPTPV